MSHPEPARINVAAASAMLGATPRTVRAWAAAGKIPGAAKLLGQFTFDRAMLAGWVSIRKLKEEDPYAALPDGLKEIFGQKAK